MTKWLRAEQNLESLLIMPNIISVIESDDFEFTMREAQSRNSFLNKVVCAHSVKRCTMVWSAGQKGQCGESSFFILNNKLLAHRILWIISYWNIDSFTSFVTSKGNRYNFLKSSFWKPKFKSLFSQFGGSVSSSVKLCADNSVLYPHIESSAEHNKLQQDLLQLEEWLAMWQMNFAPSKSYIMSITLSISHCHSRTRCVTLP